MREGEEITATRHRARKTGKVLAPPAYEDVAAFPLRVESGMLQVRDARWD